LGRSLKAKGLAELEIVALLVAVNERRCEPPLDEGEVRKIAHQAAIQPDRPRISEVRANRL
jgi:putative DNA primase/helicase